MNLPMLSHHGDHRPVYVTCIPVSKHHSFSTHLLTLCFLCSITYGPGRQIDDEHVERSPYDVFQELPHDAHHHRPPPDDGRFVVEKKPHRNQCESMLLDGKDLATFGHPRPRVRHPHHQWNARPIDVG